MPTPEELAAQEAEKAAQAAAEAEARKAAEQSGDDGDDLSEDPKVLRQVLSATRKEAAARRVKERELAEKLKALEDEQKKTQEAALAEQGKFRELAEKRGSELEATRKELEQLRVENQSFKAREETEQKQKAAQIEADFEQLPDDLKAELADADTRTKEIAVRTYMKAAGKAPRPPTTPGTAPRPASTDGKPPYTADQIRIFNQVVGNQRASKSEREKAAQALAEVRAWKAAHPS